MERVDEGDADTCKSTTLTFRRSDQEERKKGREEES